MTDLTSEAPDTPAERKQALAEARDYLAATVDVHPGTSARKLLRYVTGYRAHLATLVAACSDLDTDAPND